MKSVFVKALVFGVYFASGGSFFAKNVIFFVKAMSQSLPEPPEPPRAVLGPHFPAKVTKSARVLLKN